MLERLRQKWGVSGWRVLLILITFAVGGSLTGLLGRIIMGWLGIEQVLLYGVIYILIVTLIWPLMVLMVSIPLGQFPFFTKYIARLGRRLFGRNKES